jgi:hypothetical protein
MVFSLSSEPVSLDNRNSIVEGELMPLILLLVASWIPVGIHEGQPVWTDFLGSSLLWQNELVSSEPGSGGNPLSTTTGLYWKECPPGEFQRIMSVERGEVFSLEYFSGPFPSGSEDEMMISVPDFILILDLLGTVQKSFFTGEYPGSICSDGSTVWFVSSSDGALKTINRATGSINTVDLCFIPQTVQYNNSILLIGRADGGYSVINENGEQLLRIQDGFSGYFSGNGKVTFTRAVEFAGCEAISWETVTTDIVTAQETVEHVSLLPSTLSAEPNDDPVAHFDVPYINQRWDTPDWFNGSWSCGPTSCMMAVQYYNRLTPDSVWCSNPEGHWSEWGNYIPVEYTFLGFTYDIQGEAPGGTWVPGSHGFICRNYHGAGWSEMTLWMNQHGLSSSSLGTTWSACTAELSSSWPVVASTTSAYTGGHILLFNGYYSNHSVICNDSYGNQNLPGWGTLYNGKDVVYDWPGYNNGNTQLGISQLFSARSEVLSPAGELIDDRTSGYRKLGPCQFWHEQETGYNGYSWWTYSTGALPDTCMVEWIPQLSSEGNYLVEVFIPASHAAATCVYHITTTGGVETATVNQGEYSNQWVSLGTFPLSSPSAVVRAGDYTGAQGQYIAFDAMRFTVQTSAEESATPFEPAEFSVSRNPAPAFLPIVFNLPEGFPGKVKIFDISGRLAAETECQVPAGTLPAGLYHAMITVNGNELITRFTVTN